ncbi:MAG: hypothetical protein F9K46_00020 [Anaerolineae bacterium]|nr:MAG: hypothetical protein F9K46_00020 [Anaerolineae bacterium]
MVQISDYEWTLDALHCACLLARNTGTPIVLVEMIPVQHPTLLGTDFGYMNFSHQDEASLRDYQATIEDYGLEFTTLLFQYMDLPSGIAQAAEHVHAQIVFAHIPDSIIPLWSKFQRWLLNRQLTHQHRQWIEHPLYDANAAVTIANPVVEISHP